MSEIETVLGYHARTKHRPGRYAASLGYLDWASQPDPFRRYEGAPRVALSVVPETPEPSFDALYHNLELPEAALSHASLSQLLHDSLALSAWKQQGGARWSLRVNPSSGNLHPTEAYVLVPAVDGLCEQPSLFHYQVFEHALELRATLDDALWARLTHGLPTGSVLLGLTSIHWREAWKYGERAYRYCQHDAGHAIAAVSFAASALGRCTRVLDRLDDLTVTRLLGIAAQSGPEAEHADCMLCIAPRSAFRAAELDAFVVSPDVLRDFAAQTLQGRENQLSASHHPWPGIDEVSTACVYHGRNQGPLTTLHGSSTAPALPPRELPARPLIRRRRSAVDMDGHTPLSRAGFFRMLERVVPCAEHAPWQALPWQPSVHLALFVHRVEGVTPGLYFVFRDAARAEDIAACIGRSFEWASPEGAPDDILFLRLTSADARNAARTICCHQDIAANGAFAVAMLAELEPTLQAQGAHAYRRLHWEAGVLGQVLYLEAEAAGLSGTGIGCFFDDVMHEVLGISDARLAMLYGFTVGGRTDDPRVQMTPAYAHLTRDSPA
jgi:SagB-type dehydrogenase family enzyme